MSRFLAKWLSLCLLVSLCGASEADSQSQNELQFNRLMSDSGLATGAVEAIHQDRYGYIWFGGTTGIGVVQYDGYDFTVHSPAEGGEAGLSSGVVWDIFEDSDGELWVATDIGINRFNRDSGKFEPFEPEETDLEAPFARAIVEGPNGDLWVGFMGGLGRFDRDTGRFKIYLVEDDEESGLKYPNIRSMSAGSEGDIWIGNDSGSLSRLHIESEEFTHYDLVNRNGSYSPSLTVLGIHQTSDKMVWVGTNDGLQKLDPTNDSVTRVNSEYTGPSGMSAEIVGPIAEDSKGNLWIGSESGLYQFNRESGTFSVSRHNLDQPRSLAHNAVRSLYIDEQDSVWIGHFPSGVSHINRMNMLFTTYRHEPNNENSLSQASALSLNESGSDELLIGTDGGGLNVLDRDHGSFTHFEYDPNSPEGISAGAVLDIEPTSEGKWWLGTWGGGLNRFDQRSGTFDHFSNWEAGPKDNVWNVFEDSKGQLWIGTTGAGLGRYDSESESFKWYNLEGETSHNFPSHVVWSIFEDHRGVIWVGTGNGLARYRARNDDFVVYSHDPEDTSSLGSDVVNHIAEDSSGRLWVATRDGGLNLYNRDSETFTKITTSDGLPSNVIASVVPDGEGNIWLGTANGLSRYTPDGGQVLNFDQSNGLQGNEFHIGSGVRLRSGELAFGGIYGVTVFDPKEFSVTEPPPPVQIVELEIFNNPVLPDTPESPLDKMISQTESITLSHEQSVFSLTFVALSQTSPQRNQYAYLLEGFESEWNYVGNRRTATYTNLDPGSYTFRVKAANSQGVWNEEGQSLKVTVLPPLWQTWWAYSLYALVFGVIIFGYIRAQRQKIARERQINARLKQLDKLKDNILANTSHELRTPLNGIIGIAESLLAGIGGEPSEVGKKNLKMIVGSGRRLERLVNDILDFSQLKERSLNLNRKTVDMCALADVVAALSKPLVGDKDLVIINNLSPVDSKVEGDEDRIQQIMYNLLGNAIKFTSEGTITISSETIGNYLEICVSDTGAGIESDSLSRIFEAFQQEDASIDRVYGGAGLGLAVTKQLVELHGGRISVSSSKGVGSKFCFTLPAIRSGDQQTELSDGEGRQGRTPLNYYGLEEDSYGIEAVVSDDVESSAPASVDSASHRILLVDDEEINRQVLVNHLHLEHYQVVQASNGEEAIELALDQDFDLVLLDVMMPSVSGYEVCRRLRESFPPHELPIIFLTAKNGDDDVVTGFSLGANDYLTKPVNRNELILRVRTHLELRDINRDLETKVSERTEALKEKNIQLEKAYMKLEEISLSDPLTGLYNRRYLQKLMPLDVARIQREYRGDYNINTDGSGKSSLVFMLIDIDHFKPVNDIYGHAAGDQVLMQISKLLVNVCRDSDCLVRWGGEEFLLVSRFVDREEGPLMADRIRRAVSGHAFSLPDGRVIYKTCSIGYSSLPFIESDPFALTWEQAIDVADKALYAAKRSGRDSAVGLSSTDRTRGKDLHKRINENVSALIDTGEVSVIANDPEALAWD